MACGSVALVSPDRSLASADECVACGADQRVELGESPVVTFSSAFDPYDQVVDAGEQVCGRSVAQVKASIVDDRRSGQVVLACGDDEVAGAQDVAAARRARLSGCVAARPGLLPAAAMTLSSPSESLSAMVAAVESGDPMRETRPMAVPKRSRRSRTWQLSDLLILAAVAREGEPSRASDVN